MKIFGYRTGTTGTVAVKGAACFVVLATASIAVIALATIGISKLFRK